MGDPELVPRKIDHRPLFEPARLQSLRHCLSLAHSMRTLAKRSHLLSRAALSLLFG